MKVTTTPRFRRTATALLVTGLVALGLGFGLGVTAGKADAHPAPTKAQQTELDFVKKQATDKDCWLTWGDGDRTYHIVCSAY